MLRCPPTHPPTPCIQWHGRSGVHTGLTNTRITDPEILERRYPVLLRRFSLRQGSGGAGAFRGGLGVVRELEFRRPLVVSILSERRAFRPYGLAGGSPGARGCNTLLRAGAGPVSLGGKSSVAVAPRDRLRIETPGGGGYGPPAGLSEEEARARVLCEKAAQENDYAATVAAGGGTTGGALSGSVEPHSSSDSSRCDEASSTGDQGIAFQGSLGLYKELQESA